MNKTTKEVMFSSATGVWATPQEFPSHFRPTEDRQHGREGGRIFPAAELQAAFDKADFRPVHDEVMKIGCIRSGRDQQHHDRSILAPFPIALFNPFVQHPAIGRIAKYPVAPPSPGPARLPLP